MKLCSKCSERIHLATMFYWLHCEMPILKDSRAVPCDKCLAEIRAEIDRMKRDADKEKKEAKRD